MKIRITIMDYGVGNVGSITNFVKSLGHYPQILSPTESLKHSDVIILPGVGSAITATRRLAEPSFREPILEHIALNKTTIGLCLGAQLLFDYLDESKSSGLGICPGTVMPLDSKGTVNTGWSELKWDELIRLGIQKGLRSTDTFFFNHQYELLPTGNQVDQCQAINPSVTAIVKQKNVWAIQFHPEKSQESGKLLMRNILKNV